MKRKENDEKCNWVRWRRSMKVSIIIIIYPNINNDNTNIIISGKMKSTFCLFLVNNVWLHKEPS